jgi:hypothetical protein
MKAAEDRGANDSGSVWRPPRGQVSGAIRRLHPKPPMWPAAIVGHVVAQHAFSMLLVLDDDVVEAAGKAVFFAWALLIPTGAGFAAWARPELPSH